MKVLFLSPITLAKIQASFRQKAIDKLAPRNSLYFLFGNELSPKQIEMKVKEKKITHIVFEDVPEQTIRTTVNYLKKKFPSKKFTFFVTEKHTEDIPDVLYIAGLREIETATELQVA